MSDPVTVVLFDIDGTLLLSGGAGVRAMTSTFADVFGVAEAFATADVAGRTDTFLLSNALQAAKVPDTEDSHQRFRAAYAARLQRELQQPPRGRYGVLPGVMTLLPALAAREDVHCGLLTGNFEAAAYLKLAHFGIEQFFSWGAFGEASRDRNHLGPVALAAAQARGVDTGKTPRVIVVGDTPHDIACARAMGAQSLAVATGSFNAQQLQAAGADATLDDLADTAAVVARVTRSF